MVSKMMDKKRDIEIEKIELKLLLDAIYGRFGYDYRDYSLAHIKRRIRKRIEEGEFRNITHYIEHILHSEGSLESIIEDFSIHTTDMFRFPEFYKALREKVCPYLRTFPSVKIWIAGCSTGEEIYSIAILLKEENLLNKAKIYATDINPKVLETASKGIYDIKHVKNWTRNYQLAGGLISFSDYYIAKFNQVKFEQDLIKNVTFHSHNLVQDGSIGEFNLVICRNVMIYFNKILQDRVVNLFYSSLSHGGILGIGSKETIKFSDKENHFSVLDKTGKIYTKHL